MPTLDVHALDGWHLDYFTGLALGYQMLISNDGAGPAYCSHRAEYAFEPSEFTDELYPVMLKMRSMSRGPDGKDDWMVRADGCMDFARADSLPVAVCRALVLGVLGKTVSLPGAAASSPYAISADSYQTDSTGCEDLFA